MDRKELIKSIAFAGAGVIVGYTAGYFITKRRILNEIREELEEYRDSMRIIRNQEYATPEEAVEALIKGDEERENTETEQRVLDEFIKEHAYGQTEERNVFDNPNGTESGDPEEDPIEPEQPSTQDLLEEKFGDLVDTHSMPSIPYLGDTGQIVIPESPKAKKAKAVDERPLPDRDEEILAGKPYVISIEEFMNDMQEYDKTTITYFEGDDTLCDEREEIVPDVEGVVTVDALTRFGTLSNDRNIVYVRNDRIATDFEVIRDRRKWSEVIAGFVEPKEKSGARKMREDDEG